MSVYKRYFLMRVIVSVVFFVACGVFLLLLRPYADEFFDILLISVGLLTAVLNLPALFLALRNIRRRGEWINLMLSILSILLGVGVMLLKGEVLIPLLALFAAVLPIARIALIADHKAQLVHELPRMIFGGVLIVFLLAELQEWAFLTAGIASLVFSALYLLYGILTLVVRFPSESEE